MKTKHLQPVTTGAYGLTNVQALLSYAKSDSLFTVWFAELLRQSGILPPIHGSYIEVQQSTLAILDEYHAVKRALWLTEALAHKRIQGYIPAKQILASWVNEQEWDARQFIILGLKYGVIDYGIIGYPKWRNEPMHILIREDVAKRTRVRAVVQVCTRLSVGIVEQGLVVARGNAQYLEPELSDWLFGNKPTILLTSPKSTLEIIHSTLTKEDIPSSYLHDTQGITHLAITPAVHLQQIPDYDSLTPLD
ncbi:MAG: hypothetical protein UV60_C0009G0007 [Parcubacteria group bacterium GW2011_GWA2_43_11]|nr:MAG: hypothetical protein UU89_C0039G0004 [Parcubacteria group bacterium GW2011_GWC2_42_11]KKS85286.1 MAG: hypothetical protein UV60_C0009G0007 [Parcubacteria group bacterium GW2011_GWA2_43_11]